MVDFASLKVLVIDDQEFVRTIVRGMLNQLGIGAILEAADGTQALALATSEHPDLAICDVQMRPIDGFSFVKMLRDDDALAELPVIMLTAHADSATINRARDLDVDEFISKPVLPQTLEQTINRVIQSRAMR